jgi:hypothetical protein
MHQNEEGELEVSNAAEVLYTSATLDEVLVFSETEQSLDIRIRALVQLKTLHV